MALPLGFSVLGLLTFLVLTFTICTTVNTFAMEAAVLFVPAFLFVYPELVPAFPDVPLQAAIGLALFVELFGYTSSVSAYYYRGHVDLDAAKAILAISVPVAVVTRALSYFAPSAALKVLFGGMLIGLSAVLFRAHDGDDHQKAVAADGGTPISTASTFDRYDRLVAGVGGTMAGFVAIAIGELTQTLLTVRKRVSVRLSTGTSALVLHGTIVAALVTNLLLLKYAPPSFSGHSFTVPFDFGLVAGMTCLVGGQAGAFINSRVSERTTIRAMMVVYSLVGAFVLFRVFFL
ncbi:sulfite exporter TauE/SafE family protein [Halorussus gelatinilyticus]|uniref:Probable membrane transporter protein n=1 Tax=Halorussus gelatinilyticus TaxID=2937524 RepID=A0A8U0ILP3_9EURY|nr:sulfite exporter TauE/SafE family protein [Halorussus gelatinilyticus]UPW02050.1 sulfite exporter TauE/SafE family protein [Halorussus gelatinilyticus]